MKLRWILMLLTVLCLSNAVGQDNEAAYSSRDRHEVRPVVAPVIAAHSGKSVLFAMPSPNGCVLFARDSITVVLEPEKSIPSAKAVSEIANGDDFHALLKPQERELLADRRALTVSKPVVVRIAFVDANPDVKVEGLEKQTAEAHWMIGNRSKWKSSEPVFTGVAYRNLWPGIDLTFKSEAGKVTCLLQVSADADPSKIRMGYHGLTGMKKGDMGELAMETPVVACTDDRPEVYQTLNGNQVALYGEFAQDGDILKLDVRGHDKGAPTEVGWTSGLLSAVAGGWSLDGSRRAMFDSEGDRYLAGTVHWSESQSDCFVARVGASGEAKWVSLLGGESADPADAVCVDRHGIVYVSGCTRSTDFPTTDSAYSKAYNGSQDYFSARLDPSGKSLVYSTYLGSVGGWLGAKPMAKPAKLLAIVVDDVKGEWEIEELSGLGIPMTFAMMPYCTGTCLEYIKSRGSVAFLHAPMEALGSVNTRTREICVADKDKETVLEGWLAQFPGVVGINNHRGSMATSDPETMKVLLNVIRKHDLVFVDSHTAPVAVGANVGTGMGVPCVQQDLFLDDRSVSGVRAKVLAMAELAERTGYSVCICHVNQPAVPTALRALIPELQAKGFKFVTVPDLCKALKEAE